MLWKIIFLIMKSADEKKSFLLIVKMISFIEASSTIHKAAACCCYTLLLSCLFYKIQTQYIYQVYIYMNVNLVKYSKNLNTKKLF